MATLHSLLDVQKHHCTLRDGFQIWAFPKTHLTTKYRDNDPIRAWNIEEPFCFCHHWITRVDQYEPTQILCTSFHWEEKFPGSEPTGNKGWPQNFGRSGLPRSASRSRPLSTTLISHAFTHLLVPDVRKLTVSVIFVDDQSSLLHLKRTPNRLGCCTSPQYSSHNWSFR